MDLDISSLDHNETHPQPPQKGSVLSRNDQKWESLKQDVHKVYMSENNTLSQTMTRIEEGFGFEASPRKWKAKLKEWGFEKHLSEGDMKIVVAKMEKRRRETGKDTVVFHNGVQVPAKKIANFKRRKVIRESDSASPGASTPGPITYCTPRIDMNSLIETDEIAELDDEFNDLEFSAHRFSSQVKAVGFNVAESNNTKLRASQKENRLPSVIVGSASDKLESSLEIVTEKRNEAASEHEEEQERNLLSDLSTQLEYVPIQETEDDKHAREFMGPWGSEVDYPVIDEPNFVTDTQDTPSTELPIEEENLSALSQAIDKCFKEGWGLDVTPSQLLSMLTYVQGLDPGIEQPPKWLLSYPELEPIAALAKHYIESREHDAAVSLYKGVIKVATRLLNESEYISPSLSLNYLHMCCPTYLGHEQAILQIVIASYLKWQLAADIPSEVSSDRILRVIDYLRSMRNPKSFPMDEAVDRKLLSLNQIIAWPFGRSADQFRRELLSHTQDLANCYSQRKQFEAAEALFNLRLGTPSTPWNVSYSNGQICKDEQQNYEQHRRRRSSSPYKPRVRPWSVGDLPSLPPNSPSLCKGKVDSLVKGFCQRLIRIRRAKKFQQSKGGDRATRPPLPKVKEGFKFVEIESETDTGFTTSSTRSYRYGVTMSDSDFPGIDLSRYLNQ